MADPLSFIASVIAVASLSEKVVIKGYHYLRAVKNCPDEVRSLVAELNVLCGILGRLKVLLENDKSKLVVATNSDDREGLDLDEKSDEEEIVDSDDENSTAHDNGMSISFSVLSTMLLIANAMFKPFILPISFTHVKEL